MSSPEVEKFGISQDDLNDIYNPMRKRNRLSKNQTIYGMWAEEEDEERSKFSKRQPKDYTAPVNFVSGGVKVGDRLTKEKDPEDEITDSDEDEEKVESLPTSRFTTHKKIGVFPATKTSKKNVGDWEKHTKGIGQKLLEKMGHIPGKGLGKNLQGISIPVEAVQRKGRGAVGMYGTEKSERVLQDFPQLPDEDQKEAEEFGEKMRRWKKGEADKKKPKKYVTAKELVGTNLSSLIGRHSGKSGKQQAKNSFPGISSTDLSKIKVIDMTGKEQRILSGYQALSLKHDQPKEADDSNMNQSSKGQSYDLPELLHNLDLLVSMTEDSIIQNSKKLNFESDLIVNLEHESNRLEKICQQEENYIIRLKEVMQIVEECELLATDLNTVNLDWAQEKCCDLISRLQSEYNEEYLMFDLSSAAIDAISPLVKKEFENWNALKNPNLGCQFMQKWKDMLNNTYNSFNNLNNNNHNQNLGNIYSNNHGEQRQSFDFGSEDKLANPYSKLVWHVIIPHFRNALKSWAVRQPESLLCLLENWLTLMDDWMIRHLIDQFVFPKLMTEVDAWDPLVDTVPIHSWIHPWLFLMGDHLTALYPTIRQKLSHALVQWHPSDPSAKLILEPWLDVFNPSHVSVFVVKNILPKLAICLRQMTVNPSNQILDSWNWVMSWVEIIPQMHMVGLLKDNFFPNWLNVLGAWLGSTNPDFEEITKWYQGWKALIPQSLLNDSAIKDSLNEALEMMNHAVCGVGARNMSGPNSASNPNLRNPNSSNSTRENMAYLMSVERHGQMENNEDEVLITRAMTQPVSLKERIEKRAEQCGLIFIPISNRIRDGKQVYKLGRLQIYTDRGLVFFSENQRWIPTSSLDTLFDKVEETN